MRYFVKIYFKKYDEDVLIFEASGISEEALEIILLNYYGVNYNIIICREVNDARYQTDQHKED